MKTKLYPSKNNYFVSLGRKGEYNVTRIVFDLSAYADCYGSGYAELIVTNPKSSDNYLMPLDKVSDTEYVWVVTEANTIESGIGHAILRWYTDTDGLAKSASIETEVINSTDAIVGEMPDTVRDWIESTTKVLEDCRNIIRDGVTEELVSPIIDKYLEENPPQIDEMQVRDLIESYGFLTTHQSLDNYYTKNEVYSKSEVYSKYDVYTRHDVYTKEETCSKEEILKIANESGKVKTVNGNEPDDNGNVVIDIPVMPEIPEIPTKVSQLVNDSNFITEHQDLSEYVKKNDISNVYKYIGSVENYSSLPSNNVNIGDVYNVEENGQNYAWNGTEWDSLGSIVDLSNYCKKEDVYSKDELDEKLDNVKVNQDESELLADIMDSGLFADILINENIVYVDDNGKVVVI